MKKKVIWLIAFCFLVVACINMMPSWQGHDKVQADSGVISKAGTTYYWKGTISLDTHDSSNVSDYSFTYTTRTSSGLSPDNEWSQAYNNAKWSEPYSKMQKWGESFCYAFFFIDKTTYQNMTDPKLYIKAEDGGGILWCYDEDAETKLSYCGSVDGAWGSSSDGEFTVSIKEYMDKDFINIAYSMDATKNNTSGEITYVVYDAAMFSSPYAGISSVSTSSFYDFSIEQGETKVAFLQLEGSDFTKVQENNGVSGNMSGVQASYKSLTADKVNYATLVINVTASATAEAKAITLPINVCGLSINVPVTVKAATTAQTATDSGITTTATPTPVPEANNDRPATPDMKVKKSGNKVTISWNAVGGDALGYEIYRSEKKDKGYKRIKKLDITETSYVDESCVKGKKYYYRMQSYRLGIDQYVYSKYSTVKSVSFLLKAPKIKVKQKGQYIYLTWYNVSSAKGLQLYYKKKGGSYVMRTFSASALKMKGVRIPISKNNSMFNSTKSTYYFKARIYKKSGKTKMFSEFSKVVKTK